MTPQVQHIHTKAMSACGDAETLVLRVSPEQVSRWRESLKVSPTSATEHSSKADSSIFFAAVGLVTASGIAVAGGPATVGFAAFAAGSAAVGKALYHLVSEKFNELRLRNMPHAGTGPEVTAARAKALTDAIWDDSLAELRQSMGARQINDNSLPHATARGIGRP